MSVCCSSVGEYILVDLNQHSTDCNWFLCEPLVYLRYCKTWLHQQGFYFIVAHFCSDYVHCQLLKVSINVLHLKANV